MPWAFQIEPQKDELLSGYLCRVARAHGATPYGFCELQLGDKEFWARDCDRGVVRRHDSVLVAQSGLTSERLGQMTLRSWISHLTPASYRRTDGAAVIPWVNAVGVFHRTRRQHALQFCWECLAETGTIFKLWRLSFVVMCPVHQTTLMDACPTCDAPFVPHRGPGRINLCHVCQLPYDRAGKQLNKCNEKNALLLRLQGTLFSKLEESNGNSKAAASRDELLGLRGVLSALFTKPKARKAAEALGVRTNDEWLLGPRLELARHAHRYQLMGACAVLLEQWPESFRSVAEKLNLSQRFFARYVRSGPNWLDDEVARLVKGTPKSMQPSPRRKHFRVEKLAARRPNNWRAKRAAMLIHAARKSR